MKKVEVKKAEVVEVDSILEVVDDGKPLERRVVPSRMLDNFQWDPLGRDLD